MACTPRFIARLLWPVENNRLAFSIRPSPPPNNDGSMCRAGLQPRQHLPDRSAGRKQKVGAGDVGVSIIVARVPILKSTQSTAPSDSRTNWVDAAPAPNLQFRVGLWRRNMAARVQAGERSHAIHALRITEIRNEWELHVGPRLNRLADIVEVFRRLNPFTPPFHRRHCRNADCRHTTPARHRAGPIPCSWNRNWQTSSTCVVVGFLVTFEQIERELRMIQCLGQTF